MKLRNLKVHPLYVTIIIIIIEDRAAVLYNSTLDIHACMQGIITQYIQRILRYNYASGVYNYMCSEVYSSLLICACVCVE